MQLISTVSKCIYFNLDGEELAEKLFLARTKNKIKLSKLPVDKSYNSFFFLSVTNKNNSA